MTTNHEIQVGQRVRNRLSGIEGYVSMRTENISGYVWLHVQPGVADSSATEEPKVIAGDECEWEEIEGSVPRLDAPRVPENRFSLGWRVKDTVTGFTGIAVARTEHLNRCWSYDVQSEVIKKEDGSTGSFESFQSPRLEYVNSGLLNKIIPRRTGPKEYTPRKGF